MTQPVLDLFGSDTPSGFRLRRIEIYNWGTFHQKVWALQPQGENSLVTGDIGSGKSTLVDAITTLLVPAQLISYNKAAGADTRERSLRSYVLGYYKSERGDAGLSARPVMLRDRDSYSVLLGEFYDSKFDETVTLAQVFWLRAAEGQPTRFYVVADRSLSIREHFADFGSDVANLKKRLRKLSGVSIEDSFPPYGAAFRRRFGIDNEQALELFLQTVSMKSVGNLTEFVREHMLEPFSVESRISALVSHFDDLTRAHHAVLQAKAQVALLEPLIADCARHAGLQASIALQRAYRDHLHPFFASLKHELLTKRVAILDDNLARLAERIVTQEDKRSQLGVERDELNRAIAENGGDRLARIEAELRTLRDEQGLRATRLARYREAALPLGMTAPQDPETFAHNRRSCEVQREASQARRADIQNATTDATVELRDRRAEHASLSDELRSLRQRRSNIPGRMLAVRAQLCRDLGWSEEELPFAGELIQVRSEERAWEGAIERLLHSFGLSMLVPDAKYAQVAQWVERTHLGDRLVYYRVRASSARDVPTLHVHSLVRKLAIKPDSEFYAWLDREIAHRFNYACCETLDQLRREPLAITRAGQIKGRNERHEKDDRHRIDDRARYVLGWSNEEKIAALEKQAAGLEQLIQRAADELARLQQERQAHEGRLEQLQRISSYESFRELDIASVVVAIDRLEREESAIKAASDILRTLKEQLAAVTAALREAEAELNMRRDEQTKDRLKREQALEASEACAQLIATIPSATQAELFPALDTLRLQVLPPHTLSVEACDNREKDLREIVQDRIDNESRAAQRLSEKIVQAMASYRKDYPLETQDVDASLGAAPEFEKMLARLATDDLPRFESRFKQLLNENTIREVANFQSQLSRERQTIRERIDLINRSLRDIDYNEGRYILLEPALSTDADIRDFQQELRACTEGALTGSDDAAYSEAKFIQVQRIIERFRGREGSTDLDRRWTRKVTDVRNWFNFSASERWREDDREHEHYTDSGGKSGGQKEKLAYTVLAASLVYQFGLENSQGRARSFRFVVIDEAFGRGSDESARYGLELFRRLGLQLMIVTPLQKIQVIEPYVASVGFAHSDGRISMLRNLTIEEYRAERAARSA
jgi:uncharacterized protein YPO0396